MGNVTKIELLPKAVAAFPAMLDFIYSTSGSAVETKSENAVALRHLASCFGIKSLFQETTQFIHKDLTKENATVYLLDAKTFKNDKLVASATNIIAKHFMEIIMTSFTQLTPNNMIDLVQRLRPTVDVGMKN
jgi:hypothetical protein